MESGNIHRVNLLLTLCPGIAAAFQSRRPSPNPSPPVFAPILIAVVIRHGML
jgi:hypothetical protein